jgi:hypothetical protein
MPACLLSPQTRSNPTVTNSCRRRLCLWRPSKPFHFPTSTLAVVIGSWTLAQALTWKTTLVSSLLPLPPLAYFYNCWQRCSSSNSSLWLICHPHLVLKLHNVLISPILIKNLISIRALTCDNLVSVTFDPFGFLIKDFRTGMTLLRCDSTGELYPLRFTTNNNNSSRRSFLATHNMELWHAGLATLDMGIYIAFFLRLILCVASLKLMPVLLVAWASMFICHFLIQSMFPCSLFD